MKWRINIYKIVYINNKLDSLDWGHTTIWSQMCRYCDATSSIDSNMNYYSALLLSLFYGDPFLFSLSNNFDYKSVLLVHFTFIPNEQPTSWRLPSLISWWKKSIS